jgi:tRNA(fMet)-specific endonuclease VapC
MEKLIDSSVLIAAERGKLDLPSLFAAHGDEPLAVAAITASEPLHGIYRADHPARRAKRESFVEQLLVHLPVVAFDVIAARIHAKLWAQLLRKGKMIGQHDLIIGAQR